MGCSSSYVTADEVAEFFCRGEGYGAGSEPTLDDMNRYIKKGAARINMALNATAQCDCTHDTYAAEFLQELNLIAAALLIQCPDCSRRFTDAQREFYSTWLGEQLELIRTGQIDVCAGATGLDYPALAWAEQSVTEFNAARIVANDILRNS